MRLIKYLCIYIFLGYKLFYKADLPEWDEIDIPDPSLASYTIRSLNCGTKYQFHIIAYNEVGRSEASEVVSLTTQGGCKYYITSESL